MGVLISTSSLQGQKHKKPSNILPQRFGVKKHVLTTFKHIDKPEVKIMRSETNR